MQVVVTNNIMDNENEAYGEEYRSGVKAERDITKEKALANLMKATDMPTKLMWQNVYFWFIRNNK